MSPKLSIASHLMQISWCPVTAKLLSPRLVCTCWTARVMLEDEQRWRRTWSDTSWMSAVR